MRSVVAAVFVAATTAGCYLEPTYVAVAPAPRAVLAPPPSVDVVYEPRPGYIYVNGRYAWENGGWAWQRGYYVPERAGFVFVQGYWLGGRWLEGHWERERPGFVHTDGAWEQRGNGYEWRPGGWEPVREGSVYVRGGWVAGPGGTRTWERGRWEPRVMHPRE
jgi:hypothetical protein